jgi:tetratricopeptide (TPR) repeat protein
MAFALKSPSSAADRAERRRLMISDALSLSVLVVITALLAIATNAFYRSYASHQSELARRWLARGESALQHGQPEMAIDALRSALAYAPGQRDIEIDLAEALASAGHTQEAIAYFSSLAESEPGNGIINLQLARLAEQQGNVAQALDYYRRAIYGTWEVDGDLRRREVRLELIRFLLARELYDQAHSELLSAEGNLPEGDSKGELTIAPLMETAKDPSSALRLYRSSLGRQPSSLAALEGAARTAYTLGRAREAKQYLERALNTPDADRQTSQELARYRDLLRDSNRLLELYPSSELSMRDRSERILADRDITQKRFDSCVESKSATQTNSLPGVQPSTGSQAEPGGPLASLTSHFKRHPANAATSATAPAPSPADTLGSLADRWKQQPSKLTVAALENDPDLAQAEIQLIYDTEVMTERVCGSPSGDDALLLKIARAPEAVDER